MSTQKYTVELSTDNAEALKLMTSLRKEALVLRRPCDEEYLKCHCPACGTVTRIMRKCENVTVFLPAFEESPGVVGLDYDDWDSKPDVGDTEPQYVCEACGYVLFSGITEIDEWLKKHSQRRRYDMGHLEDLVPPLELCEQLPDGAFSDSALVHVEVLSRDGSVNFKDIVPRACVKACYDGTLGTVFGTVLAPAPTLQEIMDALHTDAEGTCECINCERDMLGWCVDTTYECHDDSGYGSDDGAESDVYKPATAALKLYLKRYGDNGS